MKNAIPYIIISMFLSFIWLSSCHKVVIYPDTPQIKFEKFNKDDSSITFSFIDGDGNIGIPQGDTMIIYEGDTVKYNLYFTLYEKKDSIYEEFIYDPPLFYRIPYIEPQGQNKTLKGEIVVSFAAINPFDPDTFKFEFYILDNTLNQSNIEITPPLTYNN